MPYILTANEVEQWIVEKLDIQQVKEKLIALGCDEENLSTQLREFKKAKYGKAQTKGFVLLGVGALLGFISCVLALVNPVPELYYWFLYGITSVAIVILFIGLFFLVEG